MKSYADFFQGSAGFLLDFLSLDESNNRRGKRFAIKYEVKSF